MKFSRNILLKMSKLEFVEISSGQPFLNLKTRLRDWEKWRRRTFRLPASYYSNHEIESQEEGALGV